MGDLIHKGGVVKGAIIAVVAAVPLAACTANQASVFRNFSDEMNSPRINVTSVDAKQRLLIAKSEGGEKSSKAGKKSDAVKYCAEPSPDVLSAISSSLATSLSVGIGDKAQGASALGGSLQEAAASIAKRNATIQLFRDGWYRLCEGSLNGHVGPSTYTLLATKYADSTVVWLATEEISGLQSSSDTIDAKKGTTADARPDGGNIGDDEGGEQPDEDNGDAEGEANGENENQADGADTDDNSAADNQDPPTASEDQNEDVGDGNDAGRNSSSSAGPPNIGVRNVTGRAASPSDLAVRGTVAMVIEYLNRARFNDCLLALDRVGVDLDIDSSANAAQANAAQKAIIDSCTIVLKKQAVRDSNISAKLLTNSE